MKFTQRHTRAFPVLGIAALIVLVAAGCRSIASPQGWAAPVITSGGVLTSLQTGKLALVDATTKNVVWTFPPDADKQTKLQGIYGTPVKTADSSIVVFGAYSGHVYALKLSDGSKVWDVDTGAAIVGSPAVTADTVYIGNSDGKLFALKLSDGTRLWSAVTGDRIWSTPVVDNGTIYLTSMDKRVYAFDGTGKQRWVSKSLDGAIASSPSVNGDSLYFGAFDKKVHALKTADGSAAWSSAPAAANWFWAEPLLPSGSSTLYTGSLDGRVYAINADTGQVLMHSDSLGDSIRGKAVLSQGVLIAAARNGCVTGFDPATLKPRWQFKLDSNVLSDLVPQSDGSVLLLTEGGNAGGVLVSIEPQSGQPSVLEQSKQGGPAPVPTKTGGACTLAATT